MSDIFLDTWGNDRDCLAFQLVKAARMIAESETDPVFHDRVSTIRSDLAQLVGDMVGVEGSRVQLGGGGPHSRTVFRVERVGDRWVVIDCESGKEVS